MTPAQLDALNLAAAHEQAVATGRTIHGLFAEALSELPTSPAEREAWAERAERILAEVAKNGR